MSRGPFRTDLYASRGPARAGAAWVAVAALLGAGAGACGDPAEAGRSRARAELEALHTGAQLPGLAVAVRRRGEPLWSDALGFADLEHEVPATPDTRFRVGSISKALTSGAIGLLVEEGRLDLDRPVQSYAPGFPERAHPITPRQLAGHLSGLPHHPHPPDGVGGGDPREPGPGARDPFRSELAARPGERFAYSSFGWNVLAAVLEGASGRPFPELMRERIFEPLGMEHTGPDHPAQIVKGRSGSYRVGARGAVFHAPTPEPGDPWAGGFLSSARDLARFGDALLGGRLLRPETRALLFRSMRTNDGEETGYGIGWQRSRVAGRPAVGHRGLTAGGSGQLLLLPGEGLVVALLANARDERVTGTAERVAEVFLGDPAER